MLRKTALRFICAIVMSALLITACSCSGESGVESSDVSDTADFGSTASIKEDEAMKVYSTVTVGVKEGTATKRTALKKDAVSVILVIGQSQFTTTVGAPDELKGIETGTDTELSSVPDAPAAGTCYSGTTVTSLKDSNDVATLCANGSLGGVCPSFGKQWSYLTGTKVVFVQAARGAVGMHEWVPNPEDYTCTCKNNGKGALYSTAVSRFKETVSALGKDYEIAITGYIWNEGAHEQVYGVSPNTICDEDSYVAAYKSMHEALMNDLELDFGAVCVGRTSHCKYSEIASTVQGSRTLTIDRVSQYRVTNELAGCYLMSHYPETLESTNMTKYNGGGVHYNQKAFNALGIDCATNLYALLGFTDAARFDGISVYNKYGEKLAVFDVEGNVTEGSAIIEESAHNSQILAEIEPVGTLCTWSLSGENYCIDQNGYIDWAKVTADENGKKAVKVTLKYEK